MSFVAYPLGSSPAEFDRLGRQHEMWRGPTEALWKLAGFGPGQTIVDLGCGPGFTTRDLAQLVGAHGRVLGIDASEVAATSARAELARHGLTNARILTANAADVDLSEHSPTGVFARWLFCYLPDPAHTLRQVALNLRPGGAIALMDYWHYLAIRIEPQGPYFATVFRAVYESFRDAGGSLDVGASLPKYCDDAGLSVRHVEPVSATGRPGSPVWAWISDFQSLYLPTLVERGYVTREVADRHLSWWKGLSASRTAFVFSPPMLSVVAVKG